MAITALPPDADADIARVTEALAMITPRWNVRILLALSGPPLRYSELAAKVSWLQNGQLHPKLTALCDAGLVERTEHTARHVTYGVTERGTALLPILPMIVTWAEEHAPRDLLRYGRIAEESGFLAFAKDELLSAIDR